MSDFEGYETCTEGSGSDHLEWGGWFEQNGEQTEMFLSKFKVKKSGKIKGKGSDTVGEFKFRGMKISNYFIAMKHYKHAHTIYYWGSATTDGDGEKCDLLEGSWGFEINEEQGPFRLAFA